MTAFDAMQGRAALHQQHHGRAQGYKQRLVKLVVRECSCAAQVSRLLCSPLQRAHHTAELVAQYQQLAGSRKPEVEAMEDLTNRDWGAWDGKLASEVIVQASAKSR